MHVSSTIRSPGAMVLGVLFASVTAYVLLEDVAHGAPITTAHVLTAAGLVGTITAAHMALPHLRAGHLLAGVGLSLLFVAGTVYTVVSAGSRNAEAQKNKDDGIRNHNDMRADAIAQLELARHRLTKAEDDKARECGTGRGRHCDGHAETIKDRSNSVALAHARVDMLGPAKRERAGYAAAAKMFAAMPFVTAKADAIEASLTMLMPFLIVLIVEFGTVIFWHVALGHKVLPDDDDKNPDRQPGDPIIDFVREAKARSGRVPTLPEVQALFPNVPRTTAWRRIKAA